MFIKILLIAITVLFLTVLVIKRFVYFAPSYEFLAMIDSFQDVYEGNLHAWYKKGTSGKVILYCHGNAGNISHRQNYLIRLNQMGHSVLIFDYSGFGKSRGIPNEQMCFSNACTFINYLNAIGYTNNNIIPYGESLGAAVATYVARRYNLPKLIIHCGLPGIKKLVKSRGFLIGLLGFIFCEFDTISYLSGYKGKSLIFHPEQDEIIPYKITEEFQSLATTFIKITGSHNNPDVPWEEISKFIAS